MILTVASFIGLVALVIFARRLFDGQRGIQLRWEGALRHLVAVGVGVFAFVILFALLQVLDLFERDLFSLRALLDILQVSLVILVGGGMILLGALMVSK